MKHFGLFWPHWKGRNRAHCLGRQTLDDLGMDTISAGQSIGFAYELYEKGIITKEDTDGLELVYGNIEPVPAYRNDRS